MSLLSTDYYSVALAPDHIALLHIAKVWGKARLLDKKVLKTEPGQELQTLTQLLGDAKSGRALNLVLSNHYLHYRLVPMPAQRLSSNELQATLKYAFRETYGDVADQWEMRVCNTLEAGDAVACAMDSSLLDSIKTLCRQRQLRFRSLQPNLMAGFNRVAASIGNQAACFVQLETSRLVVAIIDQQQWQSLRSVPLVAGHMTIEHLQALLSREFLLAGRDVQSMQVYLDAPARFNSNHLVAEAGWQLQRVKVPVLEGYVAQESELQMALGGI